MKLPDETIQRIQQFTPFNLKTSLGCTMMARKMSDTLKEPISANTLKRTFGIINSSSNTSAYTLNLIARYVGFADWDSFINDTTIQSSAFSYNEVLSLADIPVEGNVRFGYSPGRNVSMKCIGPCRFMVTESINSKLNVNDIVTAYQISKGHTLDFSSVIRDDIELGTFSAGIHNGITFFEIF